MTEEPKRVRPADAVRMAEDAAVSLAVNGMIAAAEQPLRERIEELEAENAELLAKLEKAETLVEVFRRRAQDLS